VRRRGDSRLAQRLPARFQSGLKVSQDLPKAAGDNRRMLRQLATLSVLALALGGTAVAQTAPAAPAAASPARAAFAERAASFALRGAYHTIADAEAGGASTYLDAAKTHYRDAIARLSRHDAGAASEAMAAAALARAAIAEHPVPAPRDIPAPPALADAGAPLMPHPPVRSNGLGPQPLRQQGPQMRGHRGMAGRFDATRLAADAKLANTPEAHDLAQKAVDADVARTHADFSENWEEAMRQSRIASSLAMAVRSLALADHPRTFPGPRRRPPATVGLVTDGAAVR
jgi:hypothetical protein